MTFENQLAVNQALGVSVQNIPNILRNIVSRHGTIIILKGMLNCIKIFQSKMMKNNSIDAVEI